MSAEQLDTSTLPTDTTSTSGGGGGSFDSLEPSWAASLAQQLAFTPLLQGFAQGFVSVYMERRRARRKMQEGAAAGASSAGGGCPVL